RSADCGSKRVPTKRLLHEVEALDEFLRGSVERLDIETTGINDLEVWPLVAEFLGKLPARKAFGHHQIGQEQIDFLIMSGPQRQSSRGVAGGDHFIPELLRNLLINRTQASFVLDEKHCLFPSLSDKTL